MKSVDNIKTIAAGGVVLVAAIVVAAALILVLNPGPSLETGRVESKVYDDADDWYQPGQTISGSETCSGGFDGQPRVCTRGPDIHIPGQWHHEPERFLLKLRGPHPDKPDKTITDTISVPESFWNRVRVGQWIDVDTLEIIER